MNIIKNEGVFRLFDRHGALILTDEKQLDRIIEGPQTSLFVDEDLGYSPERQKLNKDNEETLLSKCKQLQEAGCTRLEVSYDFFFGGTSRHNYPSDETTIKAFKVIRDTAKEHGMAFGASVLSPLDVGGGWAKISDETGFTYQFLETDIKPDGTYRADMVCQRQWYNNKGPIKLIPHHVLVYAFSEERIGDTPYFYVDENAICDISATADYVIEEEKTNVSVEGYGSCPMTIRGKWDGQDPAQPAKNRALCVMVYRTPELDYFAPSASAFMKKVLDMHNEAGIDYEGFYSDEMHIQFDWDLTTHFGEKEINTRYITPSLGKAYAEKYGEKYLDFPKYLIYFAYHQHDFLPGEEGKENAQHVFGRSAKDIYDTWLFRNRYFELLQRTVVNLANDAKDYAEKLWGGPIMTRAHATWQESPTCDHYHKKANTIGGFNLQEELGEEFAGVTVHSPVDQRVAMEKAKMEKAQEMGLSRYDYTPWYDWSSSIRENTAACYDYFKWNEFLAGGGTDHAEGGNLDRNYYSQALAASFGELNDYGQAYCACWGMPKIVSSMFLRVANAYGNAPDGSEIGFVNGLGTRRTDVLALYPIKLNNVEERFGSWMVQYGYCNYITEEKLLENASVTEDGMLCVKGQKFRCLVAMFEPFLAPETFGLIEQFLAAGGKVLWMSIPALIDASGDDAGERFRNMFGIDTICAACEGKKQKGQHVSFTGRLSGVKDMPILTDFLVDMVYPCQPASDASAVANIGGETIAVCKEYPNGGLALYAGLRLRDDQSGSLGCDVDTLFSVLCAMEAYRKDSLEVCSRRTGARYVLNSFADGSVACAPHFREICECWEGKFFREEDYDKAVLESCCGVPSTEIILEEEIMGHKISYQGKDFVAYRLDESGVPAAFFGIGAEGITVDGKTYSFTDRKAKFEFSPVPAVYLHEGVDNAVLTTCWTEGTVCSVPVKADKDQNLQVLACKDRVFDASVPVEFAWDGSCVTFKVTKELAGKRILIVF